MKAVERVGGRTGGGKKGCSVTENLAAALGEDLGNTKWWNNGGFQGDPNAKNTFDLGTVFTEAMAAAESPASIDQFRMQAETRERVNGGSGEVSRVALGRNIPEVRGLVRTFTNRLFYGASVQTVVHETGHGMLRRARDAGVITRGDELAFVRAVDSLMGETVLKRGNAKGERLALLEPGLSDEQVTPQMLDEAIAEILEAEILRTRKRARDAKPLRVSNGIISRNLLAISRLAPNATAKFRALIEAARGVFGLSSARALKMKQAAREGTFDEAAHEAFLAKLTGRDWQAEHDGMVRDEHAAILGQENFTPTEDAPFSLGRAGENAGIPGGNPIQSAHGSGPERLVENSRSPGAEHLRAEQLVARAKAQASHPQQPEHYGLQGERHRLPWVRQRDSSSLREVDSQQEQLAAWARANGYLIEQAELLKAYEQADLEFKGNEHDVAAFTKETPPFVIRQTKLDMFGLPWATPAEYLQRWRLSNAMFPKTASSFIGYTENARGNGVILTAQRYFEGKKKPQKEIDAALAKLGFEKTPGDATSYRHPATKVEIHDAKPDNIIFDKAGNMQPFDVWINDPNDHFGLIRDPGGSGASPFKIVPLAAAGLEVGDDLGPRQFLHGSTGEPMHNNVEFRRIAEGVLFITREWDTAQQYSNDDPAGIHVLEFVREPKVLDLSDPDQRREFAEYLAEQGWEGVTDPDQIEADIKADDFDSSGILARALMVPAWEYGEFDVVLDGKLGVNGIALDEVGINETSPFSLAPSGMVHGLEQNAIGLIRNPLKRAQAFQRLSRKLQDLRLAFERLELVAGAKRRKSSLKKEAAMREALRREELVEDAMRRYEQVFSNADILKLKSQPVHGYLADPDSPLRGRLMSKSAALQRHPDMFVVNRPGDYDGADGISRAVFGGTLMPAAAAQELFENHLIQEPTTDALWEALAREQSFVDGMKEYHAKALEAVRDAKARAKEETNEWLREQETNQEANFSDKQEILRALAVLDGVLSIAPATPISPPSGPAQWLFRGPPAESKFLAVPALLLLRLPAYLVETQAQRPAPAPEGQHRRLVVRPLRSRQIPEGNPRPRLQLPEGHPLRQPLPFQNLLDPPHIRLVRVSSGFSAEFRQGIAMGTGHPGMMSRFPPIPERFSSCASYRTESNMPPMLLRGNTALFLPQQEFQFFEEFPRRHSACPAEADPLDHIEPPLPAQDVAHRRLAHLHLSRKLPLR